LIGTLKAIIEKQRHARFKSAFLFSRWWSGGSITLGSRLSIQHRTIFQGAGRVGIGDDVTLGYSLAGFLGTPIILQPRTSRAEIVIANGAAIMNGCYLCANESIRIGADCRIGGNCFIVDSDFHGLRPTERDTPGKTAPVVIEDNVWLGVSVAVLKGVRVGRDAVIGAHAVLSKDVPNGAIVVGNPMRIVGSVYDLQEGPDRRMVET
jgi:acetyltransferase-like isoleucine patch superfamily enzyme